MIATRLPGGLHVGQVRAPALGKGRIDNVPLDGADGYRAITRVEGAGALAEAVLWADPTADFRQAVGLVGQLRRLDDAPFGGQLQPVGNVVVYRALPLAIRVATGDTALGLGLAFLDLERAA